MLSVLLGFLFPHKCRIYVEFCRRQTLPKAFAHSEVKQSYKLPLQGKPEQMGKVECANRDSVSGGIAVDGACIGSPSRSSGRAGPEYPQPLPQELASLHAPWFQQQGLKILTFSRILYNQNKESSPSSHSPMCSFLFASVSGPLANSGHCRLPQSLTAFCLVSGSHPG